MKLESKFQNDKFVMKSIIFIFFIFNKMTNVTGAGDETLFFISIIKIIKSNK